MTRSQALLKAPFALANAILPRIIRSIGKPYCEQVALHVFPQLDAIQAMLQGLLTNRRIWIAERTELVLLVLKKVGVNGSYLDS